MVEFGYGHNINTETDYQCLRKGRRMVNLNQEYEGDEPITEYDAETLTPPDDTIRSRVGSPLPAGVVGGGGWFQFFRKSTGGGWHQRQPPPSEREGRRRGSTDVVAPPRRSVSAPRPPPIPASISHPAMDAGGFATGDDASAHSVVSEVTLVTHSEEMATSIREEFLRRLAGDGDTSQEEREALLLEIQRDQEQRFRLRKDEAKENEAKERRRRLERRRASVEEKTDFFDRLNALRLLK